MVHTSFILLNHNIKNRKNFINDLSKSLFEFEGFKKSKLSHYVTMVDCLKDVFGAIKWEKDIQLFIILFTVKNIYIRRNVTVNSMSLNFITKLIIMLNVCLLNIIMLEFQI
jgi:hypothetical protein